MMQETAVGQTRRLTRDVLSVKWVDLVAKTRDTDLRAHRVALTYHYFARELDWEINGDDSVWSSLDNLRTPRVCNANWFNFGTWATVTINRDLGLRRTPAGTDRLLFTPLRRTLTPIVLHLRAADGQRVTRALSWGQRLVFLSTTLTFIHRWRPSPESDADPTSRPDAAGDAAADGDPDGEVRRRTFDAILELATWDGEHCLDESRHLTVIWDAFTIYGRAAAAIKDLRLAEDPATRLRLRRIAARRILQANLMITAVEQDIVNEAVGQAIDHLPRLLASSFTGRMARFGERRLGVPRELIGFDLPFELEPATDSLTAAWARFMTEQILVLVLPSETLRLGKDLPPRDASMPLFPPDLSDLTTLPAADGGPDQGDADNAQLCQLVAAFDRSRDGVGSAAHDWRRYDDRMNWAVNMLRSRQQFLSLFWAPYTQEDQERIIDGALPRRGGDPSDYEVEAPLEGLPMYHADRY